MLSRHVTKDISAYCHDELSAVDARQFNEHIMACAKCRAQFDEIKLGIHLAEQLPAYTAPSNLWTDLELRLAADPSIQVTQSRYQFGWRGRVAVAAAILIVVALAGLWLMRSNVVPTQQVSSWEVQRVEGTPRINSTGIEKSGQLAIGQWLETDSQSKAQIEVGTIGVVEVEPNTRVRLLQTLPTEHRLELARGKMSARIWAPPRLFFVDTPSAVAADLGCAYTLEVDDSGATLLRVTSGWVALELKDRESMVPAGAACRTRPGIGPGTPYFENASPEFRDSLAHLDFDSEPAKRKSSLKLLLSHTRERDTLTLWHLLGRVDEAERGQIYDKMASFVPPPEGVTREGVLKLDAKMLELWRDRLEPTWAVSTYLPKKVAEAYWRMKNGVQRRLDKTPTK
jgi:ferric-dicitrate binding protein FerR (iron transport regulator)